MLKDVKKLMVILMAMLFFGSMILPNLGGADRVDWTPMVAVDGIALDGMPAMTGEYANQTYQVTVTIMNNGETKLTDINVTCMITSGATIYLDDFDTSIAGLAIGASDSVDFTWDNVIEDMTYEINASVSANGFGTMVNHFDIMAVDIDNVTTWEVSELAFMNGTTDEIAAYDDSYMCDLSSEFVNHTLQIYVKNTGNQIITGPVAVAASFYEAADPTGVAARWTDSGSITGPIGIGNQDDVIFVIHFNCTSAGTTTFNISAGGQNQSFQIVFQNVTNFEVTSIAPYEDGGSYTNTIFSVDATITNTGNIFDVFNSVPLAGFSATLTIYNATMVQKYQSSPHVLTAPELAAIKDPTGAVIVTFGDINQTMPVFEDGMYYFNVTINPTESWNGYAMDDFMEIMVTLENTTDYELVISEPMAGQYDVADIGNENVVATLMNLGTETLTDDYYLQVDVESMDQVGMVWSDLVNASETMDIAGGSEKETNIGAWPSAINFIGNFTVTVTAMKEVDDSVLASDSVIVTLANGDLEGTIGGTVSGLTHTDQVTVSVWDETATTLITSVMTTGAGTDRTYSVVLPALPAGINYTIAALAADNYWYDSVMVNAFAYSSRFTLDVDLTLVAKTTSRINGSIMLMAGMDAPPLADDVDWADVELMVEGMMSKFTTNATGWFDQEVVIGTINLTAMKPNFMDANNDSVAVIAANNTTVDLTLYEMWGVMVTPVHEAMDVPIDSTVMAKFKEEINISTLNGSTVMLTDINDDPVELENITTDDNMTFELIPMADLVNDATYNVVITEAVMTVADTQAVHREWSSMFHTEAGLGHVEGWVNDETGNPLEGVAVSIGVITDTTNATGYFLLENIIAGAAKVKAELATYEMKEVDVTIQPGMTVNVTITLMKIKARVKSVTPADGATGIAVNTNIVIEFEVEMNASTINNATFMINSMTRAPVGGTITTTDNITYTFDPDANLTEDTEYVITLKKTIMAAGEDTDWFYEDLTYSFTTFVPQKYVTVTISPANGAVDQAIDVEVKITFNYAMNRTATQTAITATFVTGFTWAQNNKSVIITHADFTKGQTNTVTVGTGAKSIEGYPPQAAASSTFKIIDDTPTTETLTLNIKGKGTVTLKAPNGTEVGKKDISGNKVSFVLDTSLPAGTYTVSVKGKDDYKDKSWDITKSANGTWSGDGIGTDTVELKEEATTDNSMAIIAIIIVVIIIIILLALAMRPKKPVEEEAITEEEEETGEEEEEFECPECGAVVTSGETACPECGAEFEEEEFECPECGASVEGGVTTCPECGAEFEEEEEIEGEEEVEEEEEEFEVEDEDEIEAGEEDEELSEDEDLEEEDVDEEDEDLEEEDVDEEDEDLDEEDEDLDEEEEEEDEDLDEEDEEEKE